MFHRMFFFVCVQMSEIFYSNYWIKTNAKRLIYITSFLSSVLQSLSLMPWWIRVVKQYFVALVFSLVATNLHIYSCYISVR